MWCCQDTGCEGKGSEYSNEKGHWTGDWNEDRTMVIGAQCVGTPLQLTQPCNHSCNYYDADKFRNAKSVFRAYMPCQTTKMEVTQCLAEHEMRDGKFQCSAITELTRSPLRLVLAPRHPPIGPRTVPDSRHYPWKSRIPMLRTQCRLPWSVRLVQPFLYLQLPRAQRKDFHGKDNRPAPLF